MTAPVQLLGKVLEGDVGLGVEEDLVVGGALVHARPMRAHLERVDSDRLVDAGDLLGLLDAQSLLSG